MIRVSGLSFRYADQSFNALSGVEFDIREGDMVLVSGPTGCGKSTLGLILCRAIPTIFSGHLSGSVWLNNKSVSGLSVQEVARDLGFLLQNVEYQTFTEKVSDEIAFGLENFCVPPERIDAKIEEALHLVKGQHLLNRRLATLSAGERQRVMLAAMLVLDQQVLVLDEPLAYLDLQAQQRFVTLMGRLSKKGKTILLFEHRRDAVQAFAQREIYLNGGRVQSEPSIQRNFEGISNYPAHNTVLAFDNVSFAWRSDKKPLFEGISFDVKQHESVVLLGDNGSGKTTLMNLAMGLVKPCRGRILNCGHDVGRSPVSKIARETAFIFQRPDHQLYLPYVLDEIRSQSVDANAARCELEAMGLEGLEKRHPRSLSMGQKRRLTLAAALARRPKLMLLDEPSVGQDDDSLAMIIRRLDGFLRDGGALLTATHDVRVARALAHRIVEFNNGGIVQRPAFEIRSDRGQMEKCGLFKRIAN
ncbi:MAG: ABC transporter ATP-binding protein [Desulfosoma sp.]|uniref:ABC transporter ATP-binding protein n=1 Tax=Desulfosoma sp. TaxID=2603217 RepID=UPI004049DD47